MSQAFSPGVDNVLAMLRSKSRDSSSSPRDWNPVAGRVGKKETVHEWFFRCVNEQTGGDVGPCQIAENLAVFVALRWRGDEVSYVNCQALVTIESTLVDFYLDPSVKAQYLRLDYDLGALGGMSREPAPHVHVHPDGEPRFAMAPSRNILMDFFDFIYRNYLHDTWLDWAEEVWSTEAASRNLEPAAFWRVSEAFDASQYKGIEEWKKELGYMKRAWRQKKDALWGHMLPAEEVELLSYEPSVEP